MQMELKKEGNSQKIHKVNPYGKSDNNPDCFVVYIEESTKGKAITCFSGFHDFILKLSTSELIDLTAPYESTLISVGLSNESTRESIWKRLFPDIPVPTQDRDNADELFGMLSDCFEDDDDPELILDRILRDVKGK